MSGGWKSCHRGPHIRKRRASVHDGCPSRKAPAVEREKTSSQNPATQPSQVTFTQVADPGQHHNVAAPPLLLPPLLLPFFPRSLSSLQRSRADPKTLKERVAAAWQPHPQHGSSAHGSGSGSNSSAFLFPARAHPRRHGPPSALPPRFLCSSSPSFFPQDSCAPSADRQTVGGGPPPPTAMRFTMRRTKRSASASIGELRNKTRKMATARRIKAAVSTVSDGANRAAIAAIVAISRREGSREPSTGSSSGSSGGRVGERAPALRPRSEKRGSAREPQTTSRRRAAAAAATCILRRNGRERKGRREPHAEEKTSSLSDEASSGRAPRPRRAGAGRRKGGEERGGEKGGGRRERERERRARGRPRGARADDPKCLAGGQSRSERYHSRVQPSWAAVAKPWADA